MLGNDRVSLETIVVFGDITIGSNYESEDINPKNGKTFGELYMKTIVKENVLKSMGFNVVSIWESEFDKEVRK